MICIAIKQNVRRRYTIPSVIPQSIEKNMEEVTDIEEAYKLCNNKYIVEKAMLERVQNLQISNGTIGKDEYYNPDAGLSYNWRRYLRKLWTPQEGAPTATATTSKASGRATALRQWVLLIILSTVACFLTMADAKYVEGEIRTDKVSLLVKLNLKINI